MAQIALKVFTGLLIGDIPTLITTISGTAGSIINTLNYISGYSETEPGVKDVLDNLLKMDLEFTVMVISELINEQKNNHHNLNNSVRTTLEGVSLTLNKIHAELEKIQDAVGSHNSKWFSSLRKFKWDGNMQTIENYKDILKNRYTILFELLKIYKGDDKKLKDKSKSKNKNEK